MAATAPMEKSTSGGTPLATQKAPVQSMPRVRDVAAPPASGGLADTLFGAVLTVHLPIGVAPLQKTSPRMDGMLADTQEEDQRLSSLWSRSSLQRAGPRSACRNRRNSRPCPPPASVSA